MLCGGAVLLCAAFALAVFLANRPRGPQVPSPEPVPVTPAVYPQAASAPVLEPPPTVSVAPDIEPLSPPPMAAQPLTEQRFVEISALMVLAGESFTDSEIGRKSLEVACQAILEENGVDRAEFERMSEEIAADPTRRAQVEDRVCERVDRLGRPRDLHVGDGPSVDPHRRPPTPPRPIPRPSPH
jgi:hypothetical protein